MRNNWTSFKLGTCTCGKEQVRLSCVQLIFFTLLGLVFSLPSLAQEGEDDGTRKFAGLRFGVGLSLTLDTGKNDRVDEAQIVDGLTRVDKESNARARIMLESHYFFTPERKKKIRGTDRYKTGLFGVNNGSWGIGPFIAIQPGTDEIIEAIGAGVMIGFKRKDQKSSSWNFGIGAVVDPNVQILGDGFEANEAPPGNEEQVRFKEKAQVGVLLMTSFSF